MASFLTSLHRGDAISRLLRLAARFRAGGFDFNLGSIHSRAIATVKQNNNDPGLLNSG